MEGDSFSFPIQVYEHKVYQMAQVDGSRLVYAFLEPEQLGELEEIRAFYGALSRARTIRLLIRAEAGRLTALAPAVEARGGDPVRG